MKNEIAREIGIILLWGMGLFVIPLIGSLISMVISDGDEDVTKTIFIITMVLYVIVTAIILIII